MSTSPSQKSDEIVSLAPCFLGMSVENYLGQYTGKLLTARMECIATQVPSIAHAILKRAEKMLIDGYDSDEYSSFIKRAQNNGFKDFVEDEKVILIINERFKSELDKLNSDLSTYKNNLRREMVFSVYKQLGELYLKAGHFNESLEIYTESFPYALDYKEKMELSYNIIRVATYSRQFVRVKQAVMQIESLGFNIHSAEFNTIFSICKAALGLQYFWASQYFDAAYCFLNCFVDMGKSFNEFLIPSDIANLATLSLLSSFSNKEIKEDVILNKQFLNILESMEEDKSIIYSFHKRDYKTCLNNLKRLKSHFLLSPLLQGCIDSCYERIIQQCICHYIQPYSVISIERIGEDFGEKMEVMEKLMVQLEVRGIIRGKIDVHNHIFEVKEEDEREKVLDESLNKLSKNVMDFHQKLLHMNVASKKNFKKEKEIVENSGKSERMGLGGEGNGNNDFRGRYSMDDNNENHDNSDENDDNLDGYFGSHDSD